MSFTCTWRHPECAAGPGPNHFRHVPTCEAAAMPETPDWYLLQLPLDLRTCAAVLQRDRLQPEMVERLGRTLVHLADCERGKPLGFDQFDEAIRQVTVYVGRPEITAADLTALIGCGIPLAGETVEAVAASPKCDQEGAVALVARCAERGRWDLMGAAFKAAASPHLKALAELVLLDVDVSTAATLAPQLAAMNERQRAAARELANRWSGPPGGFVTAAAALG